MKSIQEIFENSLFRIPDYQRGYSWQETHLDDFWQDLQNLGDNKFHYTGVITLEVPTEEDVLKWHDDKWLIDTGSFKPFYLVDGQQRLTTIMLILNLLIKKLKDEDLYVFQSKIDLETKYLFKKNSKLNLQSFIFGYEVDDPSYEYLKTKIFGQQSSAAINQPDTIYTNNLGYAHNYFQNKIQNNTDEELEVLFRKITQQLKFDVKILEQELDIFVVFETMNNRGKPLSNLEKLKNRLIYLSTLLPDANNTDKKSLRKEINNVWKSCYEFLGKNKRNPLNDDIFLRNHFICYHNYDKDKDFPHKNIFKDIYTPKNIIHDRKINLNNIREYILSLQEASKVWFMLNNAKPALDAEYIDSDQYEFVLALNRLKWRIFGPLSMAFFLKTQDPDLRYDFLEAVEKFIVLNYYCAGRRSTYMMSDMARLANNLYNDKSFTLQDAIDFIVHWTYDGEADENEYYIFKTKKFIDNIQDYFSSSKRLGYYSWPGIRYLLFYYEDFIKGDESPKVGWGHSNSIEHIFPQNAEDAYWKEAFKGFSPKHKKILCNSLGNLVLIRQNKNSELSNASYDFKKNHDKEGKNNGFYNGSFSEIELSQYPDWNVHAIYERGKKILNFLQETYELSFTPEEIDKLLLIEDSLIEKVKTYQV